MKILMVNYEFPPIGGGGGNAHYFLLKEYSRSDDLRVDVLTSAQKPGFYCEDFADNIRIFRIGLHKKDLHYWRKTEVIEWLLKAWPRYKKMLAEGDYDLAHAFFGFPSGWLCCRTRKQLPYIISLRGSDVPGYNRRLAMDYKVLAPVFKRIWKNASVVVACSEGLRRRAIDFYDKIDIVTVPNGVDSDLFYPVESSHSNIKKLRLLTAGRLSATKRVELLIEAVAILRDKGIDCRLSIVGEGSCCMQLSDLLAEKGLGDYIKILGWVEPSQMPDIYRSHDIFVSATMQEGMSNVMLEAMASGLPIVTTLCEGVEELIDSSNGVIVTRADAREFTQAIKSLTEKSDFPQYCRNSRNKALEMTWAKATEQFIGIYKSIVPESNL